MGTSVSEKIEHHLQAIYSFLDNSEISQLANELMAEMRLDQGEASDKTIKITGVNKTVLLLLMVTVFLTRVRNPFVL